MALWLSAMLMLASVPSLVGAATAASSSKPKEIIVVGRKIKEASKIEEKERPARVVFEIIAERVVDDGELRAVKAEAPSPLNDLCPASDDDARWCEVEEIESSLQEPLRKAGNSNVVRVR